MSSRLVMLVCVCVCVLCCSVRTMILPLVASETFSSIILGMGNAEAGAGTLLGSSNWIWICLSALSGKQKKKKMEVLRISKIQIHGHGYK